jgi:hypothetical protein
MVEYEGKVKTQDRGRGFYARVWVRPDSADVGRGRVTADRAASPTFFREEGWLDAAVAGAQLALKLCGSDCAYQIVSVHGMVVDTKPTTVAIAAMRAVWDAECFEPPVELESKLHTAILRSDELRPEDLESHFGCPGAD